MRPPFEKLWFLLSGYELLQTLEEPQSAEHAGDLCPMSLTEDVVPDRVIDRAYGFKVFSHCEVRVLKVNSVEFFRYFNGFLELPA